MIGRPAGRRAGLLAAALCLAPAASWAQAVTGLSGLAPNQPVSILVSGWQPVTDMPVGEEIRRQMLIADAQATRDGVVDALRAGGDLTEERAGVLGDLARLLHISHTRRNTEIRRALNSELFATIAVR